jgi:thiosulfate/3-mercaptopyruvate sulfurtransferase
MDTLVSTAELSGFIANPDVLIFDCRFSLADQHAGRKAYQESHIPGARYADLNKDLSTPHIPGKTGRHPLPDKSDWIKQVQIWGIRPELQVIVYDDANGAFAARMWWMLRWIGHEKVAVLNGGWQTWGKVKQPTSTNLPRLKAPEHFDYASLASLTELIDADQIDSNVQCLVDARESPRFNGDVEPIDPIAGHIPDAICSPFGLNIAEDGLFKSPDELRTKFSKVIESNKRLVCYCGSGVTAAHNILALKLVGITDTILYAGSWSEWITDSDRPIATGK